MNRLLWTLPLGLGALTALGLAVGCEEDEPSIDEQRDGRPLCLATSRPLQAIASRLVGGSAQVLCVVPAGQDVRDYRPDRERLRQLATADLVVAQGAGLERWLGAASIPLDRRVVAAESFWSSWIESDESITHRHGNGEEHTHTGTDPHVWFDPRLTALMVRSIADGLAKALPSEAEAIESRTVALLDELVSLGKRIDALRAKTKGVKVLSTHPTWRYLARRLELQLIDTEPTAAAIESADPEAKLVFFERAPEADLAASVASSGRRVVVVRPQVRAEEDEPAMDLIAWYTDLLDTLEQALAP